MKISVRIRSNRLNRVILKRRFNLYLKMEFVLHSYKRNQVSNLPLFINAKERFLAKKYSFYAKKYYFLVLLAV